MPGVEAAEQERLTSCRMRRPPLVPLPPCPVEGWRVGVLSTPGLLMNEVAQAAEPNEAQVPEPKRTLRIINAGMAVPVPVSLPVSLPLPARRDPGGVTRCLGGSHSLATRRDERQETRARASTVIENREE